MTKEFLPGLIGTQRLTHDMSITCPGKPCLQSRRAQSGRPALASMGLASQARGTHAADLHGKPAAPERGAGHLLYPQQKRDKPRWQAATRQGHHDMKCMQGIQEDDPREEQPMAVSVDNPTPCMDTRRIPELVHYSTVQQGGLHPMRPGAPQLHLGGYNQTHG